MDAYLRAFERLSSTVGDGGLFGSETRRVDPSSGHASRVEPRFRRAKPRRVGLVERDLERAAPRVFDRAAGAIADAAHEVIEQREASRAELQERRVFVGFDVRREDAGRRTGRPASGRSHVEDGDVRTAPREGIGDGDADDARAGDDD